MEMIAQNPILFAVLVLGILGLGGSIILVLASKFMTVREDPRIAQVAECLAGANCGGCGYAGCADYAKAIVADGAPTFKCAPGGDKAADAINRIMGQAEGDRPSLKACVVCAGGENCGVKFEYQGIQTCAAAASLAGGPSACAFGCLGYGDCTRACKFDAIHVIKGVARVDREKCTGCTACTRACPRGIIKMKPVAGQPAVKCSNTERGAAVIKVCKVGCIACGLCEKNCPHQAVFVQNNVALIDYTKCNGCGICVAKCPKKVIQWIEGKPGHVDAPVPTPKVL
jgi:RnfABCDGE-type electron transport complex B subunit